MAIYAYNHAASPVDIEAVVRVRDAMAHRGPDESGQWISADARVALGHRRLSIIDLSPGGSQPMRFDDAGLCITFNGQIYNYKELRRTLEQAGHVFRSQSDTEVLLHAYAQYGADVVDHLRGMYAFAIWDEHRRGLFLARDPFGIKPLYYSDDSQRITIASEVKALRIAVTKGQSPCPVGQVSFLLWGFVHEPYTLDRNIRAIPAGSTMWVDERGMQPAKPYWSQSDVLRQAQDIRLSVDLRRDFAGPTREVLRHTLVDSLRHHFVSDVPVGLFLSGGRDSTTLLGLAAEEQLGELRALTLGFEEMRGTPADETALAAEVARMHSTRHHVQWTGAAEFESDHDRVLTAMDQPSVDGINVFGISKMAAKAGLKVAISGLGADELFAGYPSFRQIPKLVSALAPFRSAPAVGRAIRAVSAPILKHFTSPKYASLFEYGTTTEEAYFLRRGLFMPWELPAMLAPEIVKEGWEALAPRFLLRSQTEGLRDPRAAITSLELSVYMRNQLLRDSDWAGMAHSLEIRVPFVDHVLFKTLAPFLIGPTQFTKIDMANILRLPLPDHILHRPKTGFSVPVRDWLMKNQAAQERDSPRGLRGWAQIVLAHQLNDRVQRRPATR